MMKSTKWNKKKINEKWNVNALNATKTKPNLKQQRH